MAPIRKSGGVCKRFSFVNELSLRKDGENSKSSLQRKRKLSDMLGSQWSKEELECFYGAYRKYGKDWKKVGAAVQNRSVEMVEALYMMNKAYLSLPEGIASMVGFTAMMTNRYCNLAGSDGGQESNGGGRAPQTSPNHGRTNVLTSFSKRCEGQKISNSLTAASDSDCLPLLKKKRTGASVLAKASPRGGSPEVSLTPNRRTGIVMSSPIWTGKKTGTEVEHTSAKYGDEMDKDGFEGSLGSMVSDKGAVTAVMKEGRIAGKKLDIDYKVSSHFDDRKEACCGIECQNFGFKMGKIARHIARKKRKNALIIRDEGSAFDAVQTLADVSLMMQETVNDEENNLAGNDESPETVPGNHQGVRTKSSEVAKTSKHGTVTAVDVSHIPEPNEEPQRPTSRLARKKQKMFPSKIPRTEVRTDTPLSEEAEVIDAVKKPVSKWKRPSRADHRREKAESALSNAQVPVANRADWPDKVKSRRKADLQKPQNLKDINKVIDTDLSNSSIHDGAVNLKVMLSNSLLNFRARRWCACEWFYNAIDYPWFAEREFVEYLNHVGLGHVPRLTRAEWGVVRSSLGKPRRFSDQFLKEEKERLNQYRDSAREHYAELHDGTRDIFPTHLAQPLSVGQRVVAIHPRTREIHDGNVLTVKHDRCRVQFDQPVLGVEFVPDIDCMPSNTSENMPASLATYYG